MALREDRTTVDCAPIAESTNKRFGIAADGTDVSPEEHEARVEAQRHVRDQIAQIGFYLGVNVMPGREHSLALTHLEEALMWAGKAIHS